MIPEQSDRFLTVHNWCEQLGSDTIYLIKFRQVFLLSLSIVARLPRYFVPGQPQHIILRGNNRQAIFTAEQDYLFFRNCLVEAAQRFGLAVHAYVWMTHHVHLLATPNDVASLPKTLQSAGRRYVQYFNVTYGRSGTLWEGRYRATVIDSEPYLLTCMRYVEENPVRAGRVVNPGA